MKSKLLLLSFLMLLTVATNYAQTSSAETSGIAVQGIARDINNTARANEDINLTFSIYYKVLDVAQPPIVNYTAPLTTDAFGVFSHVITNPYTNNAKFANYQMWLKIDEAGQIISDEKLKHVPYAISANNGVPVGSIMPYVGTTAPAGWALCNGQNLTAIVGSEALIALLGSNNAPNLGGMFLRGTGGSGNHVGPALKGTQQDAIESHNSSGSTTSTGGHNHDMNFSMDRTDANGDDGSDNRYGTDASDGIASETTDSNGEHNHTVTVSYSGAFETRPVNYGVNYIIKL